MRSWTGSSIYPEEVVLDRLEWLYEQQIRRVAEEISALLLGYQQSVDVETYSREEETFSRLLDHARKDSLSVQELEAVLKRLCAQRCVLTVAACLLGRPTRQPSREDRALGPRTRARS